MRVHYLLYACGYICCTTKHKGMHLYKNLCICMHYLIYVCECICCTYIYCIPCSQISSFAYAYESLVYMHTLFMFVIHNGAVHKQDQRMPYT
jgi:hypothetical protein